MGYIILVYTNNTHVLLLVRIRLLLLLLSLIIVLEKFISSKKGITNKIKIKIALYSSPCFSFSIYRKENTTLGFGIQQIRRTKSTGKLDQMNWNRMRSLTELYFSPLWS